MFYLNIIVSIALFMFGVNYVSYTITGENFNEASIYQLTVGFDGFNPETQVYPMLLGSVGFVGWAALSLFLHRFPVLRGLGRWSRVAVCLPFAIYVVISPVTRQVAHAAASIFDTKMQASFREEYRRAPLKIAPQKNLVYLYLESFEATFLNEVLFPGLAPNLSALQHEADSFTAIGGLGSASWTMGGVVASQCGIPLVTPVGSGNSMGKVGSFLPQARCLGDILKNSGYHLEYMGGAPSEFAGKDKFYSTHGFASVKGADAAPVDEARSEWGRFDDATLKDVAARFRELSAAGEPFGLFTLTVDTHAPNGYMGPACEGVTYGDGRNPMLNAVHCSDKVVGDFIRKIRSTPGAENTIFVVASDHLSMLNTATPMLQTVKRRNLLLVFDGGQAPRPGGVSKPGTTLDIGATVLDYLTDGHLNELGLGVSLRHDRRKSLLERDREIAAVDRRLSAWRPSLLSFWNFASSIGGGFLVDSKGVMKIGDTAFQAPVGFRLKGSNIEETYIENALAGFDKALKSGAEALFVDRCAVLFKLKPTSPEMDRYCYFYTPGRQEVRTGVLEAEGATGLSDLQAGRDMTADYASIYDAYLKTGIMGDDRHVEPDLATLGRDLKIVSAAYGAKDQSRVELGGEVLDAVLKRGLNVVAVGADGRLALKGNIDLCAEDEAPAETVASLTRDGAARYIIVASDSVFCSRGALFNRVFAGSVLASWQDIGLRHPYIAVIEGGRTHEYLGRMNGTIVVTAEKAADLAGM